jgi:hypothetical protein
MGVTQSLEQSARARGTASAPVAERHRTVDEMHGEQPQSDVTVRSDEGTGVPDGRAGPPRLSRRQAMGHMSAVAAAGAVAWVVPEILTARPAGGATLSSPVSDGASVGSLTGGSTDPVSMNGPDGVTAAVHTTPAADSANPLAFTGLIIQRDAEVGGALVAGGWAMRHWASRSPKPVGMGSSGAHQADGAAGD